MGQPLQHPSRASFPSPSQAEPCRVSSWLRLTIKTKEHLPGRNTFLLLISTGEEEEELSACAENKAEHYHLYYPRLNKIPDKLLTM